MSEIDDANAELNVVDIYGHNTINANDLDDDEERLLTIKRVGVTHVDPWEDDEDQTPKKRAEFYFEEEAKSFIPGKQVIYMVAGAFGPELTKWVGKQVVLFRGTWRNGGRTGVRIEWRPYQPGTAPRKTKTRRKRR